VRRWQGGYWLVGVDNKQKLTPAKVRQIVAPSLVQHVYLDPLDTPVLFGATQPVAFEIKPAITPTPIELEGRGPGEVHAVERHVDAQGRVYGVDRKTGLRYTVYSDLRQPPEAELKKIPDGPSERGSDLKPYLTLPPDLPERVAALARRITADAQGPYARARAVEKYLQSRYRYTLDLKRDERYEPLEDFLFVQRAGHCAYFASAMAVMLRVVGVPTRTVNGFLAGEWNGYGKYLAVRQGDAHSWVEVWLDGAGWITFDPTPAGPARAAAPGLFTLLRQMADTAELAWFKYVIEYDLGKQVDMVQGVRDFSSGALTNLRLGKLSGGARFFFGLVALALAIAIGLRRMRRGRRLPGRPEQVVASHAFARALRALERRGYPRGMAETGRELAGRVSRGGDPAAQPFAELVELYYAARFGEAEIPGDDLERLASAVVSPVVDPARAGS
jgi:transglutaminase-like putative cysteine protease